MARLAPGSLAEPPATKMVRRSSAPAAGRGSPAPVAGQRSPAPAAGERSSVPVTGGKGSAASAEMPAQMAPRPRADPRVTPSG